MYNNINNINNINMTMNSVKNRPIFIKRNIKVKIIEYMIFNIDYTFDNNVNINSLREVYKSIEYIFYQYLNFEMYYNSEILPDVIKRRFLETDTLEKDVLVKVRKDGYNSLKENDKKTYHLYLLRYIFSIYYEIINSDVTIKRRIDNIYLYIKDSGRLLYDFDANTHIYAEPLVNLILDKINNY